MPVTPETTALHRKQSFDGARRFSRGGANQPIRVRLSHLLSSRPARVSAAGPILPVVRDRWGTGRIEAFSDGVFSIAATLLVLEIAVPEADFDHLWKGIADQWPSYLSYATSFLTIGGIWLVHHAIFRRLRFADFNVTRLNLLLLMAVAFLPFPTKLVAEAIDVEQRRARRGPLLRGDAAGDLRPDHGDRPLCGLATGADRRGGPRRGRGAGGAVESEPRLLRRRLGAGVPVAQGRGLRLPRDRGVRDHARPRGSRGRHSHSGCFPGSGSPATAGGCLERCHRSPSRRSERRSSRRSTRIA